MTTRQNRMDLAQRLPVDIVIQNIVPCLDYTSWIRAAVVSRAWRIIFRQGPMPPAGGAENIPCMWLTGQLNHSIIFPPFTSTYPFHLCKMVEAGIGRSVLASCGQLLWIYSPPKLIHVYNPFTGFSFPLPRPPESIHFYSGALSGLPCSDMISDRNFVAAIFSINIFYICRSGDHRWTKLTFQMGHIVDAIFHGGSLYVVDDRRQVEAYNIASLHNEHPCVVVPAQIPVWLDHEIKGFFKQYLVESCYGELLVVSADFKLTKYDQHFVVHRVDKEAGRQVRVNDLGQQMIFVQMGSSRSVLHRSGSWPSSFFTRNAIYFTHIKSIQTTGRGYRGLNAGYTLGKYSLRVKEKRPFNYFIFHRDVVNSFKRPFWISPP